MSKPSWNDPKQNAFLTDAPQHSPEDMNTHRESFLCFNGWGGTWNAGWKTYDKLWVALRYGMNLGENKNERIFVKNLKTNEIVWKSWEDVNPYRGRN